MSPTMETILIAMRNAGQTVDDAPIITMVLKCLPEYFNPFFHICESQ